MTKQLVLSFIFIIFHSSVDSDLIESNNRLALKLLNVLPQNENNFYSPLSLTYSLYALLNGADGQTRTELNRLFNIDQTVTSDVLNADIRPTLDSIIAKNSDSSVVRFANRLLVSKHYELRENYKTLIKEEFNSSVDSVDFSRDAVRATDDINRWVSEQTDGKIERLFETSFDNKTVLVVSNALYFGAQWFFTFDNESTTDGPFYRSDGRQTSVPVMRQMRKFRQTLSQELNARLIELPFVSESNSSMIIILPNEKNGLNYTIQNLNYETLSFVLDKLSNARLTQTILHLPKFEIETNYNLKSPLKEMGLLSLIEGPANLSRMIADRPLKLSEAIHKAVVKVNEEGVEAAAAVGLIGIPHIWIPPVEFKVDRPFLFLIRDNKSGLVLFLGQVNSIGQ